MEIVELFQAVPPLRGMAPSNGDVEDQRSLIARAREGRGPRVSQAVLRIVAVGLVAGVFIVWFRHRLPPESASSATPVDRDPHSDVERSTSEHVRIYREGSLIEAAWEALEQRDFERARELIEEHRFEYQGHNGDLDEGMSLLADCMEHPSTDTRARARRFYDEEAFSTARRRIRRWCLDR